MWLTSKPRTELVAITWCIFSKMWQKLIWSWWMIVITYDKHIVYIYICQFSVGKLLDEWWTLRIRMASFLSEVEEYWANIEQKIYIYANMYYEGVSIYGQLLCCRWSSLITSSILRIDICFPLTHWFFLINTGASQPVEQTGGFSSCCIHPRLESSLGLGDEDCNWQGNRQ